MEILAENLKASLPAREPGDARPRILLGQLAKRGDCLYATAIARQIKHDYPGCSLVWAVSPTCRGIVERCPFVDTVWEIDFDVIWTQYDGWITFKNLAECMQADGEFMAVFLPQIYPGNFWHYDGSTHTSILASYPTAMTQPIQPTLKLMREDIEKVRQFATDNQLESHRHVILFECEATSGQSPVTPAAALRVAKDVLRRHSDCCVILSSTTSFESDDPRLIDASCLGFVENAELTHYCTLLVGCSSGISWLATADCAKPLPKVQVLRPTCRNYASMCHDLEYLGQSTDGVLEMYGCTAATFTNCIDDILRNGFASAKSLWHETPKLSFHFYFLQVYCELIGNHRLEEATSSLQCATNRYKSAPDLERFVRLVFLPFVRLATKLDPTIKTSSSAISALSCDSGATAKELSVVGAIARLCAGACRGDPGFFGRRMIATLLKRVRRGEW